MFDPFTIDPNVPTAARIYDYLLGGKDNFAGDRIAGDVLMDLLPFVRQTAFANRRFLKRAVQYLAREEGVRQFIDLGSGLPTVENVHEVAREVAPDAKVVYVDNDPTALVHARALLAGTDVAVVNADLRIPAEVLTDKAVRGLLDFGERVAVLAFASLHFVGDHDKPDLIVQEYMRELVPGSCLALSHVTAEAVSPGVSTAARAVYDGSDVRVYPRSRDEITRLLQGLTILPPGVVDVAAWPEPTDDYQRGTTYMYGAVAQRGLSWG